MCMWHGRKKRQSVLFGGSGEIPTAGGLEDRRNSKPMRLEHYYSTRFNRWCPELGFLVSGHLQVDICRERKELRLWVISPVPYSPTWLAVNSQETPESIQQKVATWASFLALQRKVVPSIEELPSQAACESENGSGDRHLPVLVGTLAQTWEAFSTRNEKNRRLPKMEVTLSVCTCSTRWRQCKAESNI